VADVLVVGSRLGTMSTRSWPGPQSTRSRRPSSARALRAVRSRNPWTPSA